MSGLQRHVALAWLVTLFVIPPLFSWNDKALLFVAMTVVPMVGLAIWIAGIPFWAWWVGGRRVYQRRYRQAATFVLLPLFGAAVALAGFKTGDVLAVLYYRSALHKPSVPGAQAQQHLGFVATGGFLDINQGIAHDRTGEAAKMMPLAPGDRPLEWQSRAIDVMRCRGNARHLIGNYFAVTASAYDC